MRKQIFTALIIVATGCFYWTETRTNEMGAPGGHSGAPGEGKCSGSSCHISNSPNAGTGNLTLKVSDEDGEVNGYIPAGEYTVSIFLKGDTSQGMEALGGFELVALGSDGASRGTFTLPPDMKSTSKVIGGETRTYATHSMTESFSVTMGQQWDLGWTAPSTSVGTITLYAAAVSGDGDGSPANDFIYTTAMPFGDKTGLNVMKLTSGIEVFPTITTGIFHLSLELPRLKKMSISLMDLQGKELKKFENSTFTSGSHFLSYNISDLEPGVYLLKVSSSSETILHKIFRK